MKSRKCHVYFRPSRLGPLPSNVSGQNFLFLYNPRHNILWKREKHKTDRHTRQHFVLLKSDMKLCCPIFINVFFFFFGQKSYIFLKKTKNERIKKMGLVWRVFYNKYWFHHRNKIDVVNWTGPSASQPGGNEMSRNERESSENHFPTF